MIPRTWFSFVVLLWFVIGYGSGDDAKSDKHVIPIGVIIDVNSRIGKEVKVAMELAAQNYNKTSNIHKLSLSYPTGGDAHSAITLAEELIKVQKVKVIIGMHTWEEAALVASVGSQFQVPIISFAAPSMTPPLALLRWPFLIKFANNGSAYTKCISDIVHSYDWKKVIVIYEDGVSSANYGMLLLLSEALQSIGASIEYHLALPPVSSLYNPGWFIHQELLKLLKIDSRVFIVLQASLDIATHLFKQAKEIGLVEEESVWIIPETITNQLDIVNTSVIYSMEGAIGIRTYYSESSDEYRNFQVQFRKIFRTKNPEEDNRNPGIHALRAYDSISIVTHAINRMGGNNRTSPSTLVEEILHGNVMGLSGKISFEQGQLLHSPVLRIVNVWGKSYKEIDFWTQEVGFSINNPIEQKGDKINTDVLVGKIVWPGNSRKVPKGWKVPTISKKMKIGVPGRTSFSKFVKVEYRNTHQENNYSGFCIDIFEKVVSRLGYNLAYDYVPFNGTYDDLVQQVYNKTYDAVVGDMTILAERLQYVDFTVPYAESGLTMIVPEKNDESVWMFMKPFTWEMWVTTGLILIYTMFVVCFLERESNPEFSGPWKNQISTALWFTFSSLFFAHREKVYNNLTRAVIVVWLFVVLILTSSYTASLSSMLTVQRLQPNITDMEWLKRTNSTIGCDGDSFVRMYLENVYHFEPNNIINISSEYKYRGEFENKHIVAAFLELPYGNVFINKYCEGYSASPASCRFGGLGFMFQKGSPLTEDVSKAILELSENGELKSLEEKWLTPSHECYKNITSNATQSLKLGSFWVLYLISGATSTICFLIAIAHSLKTTQINGINIDGRIWEGVINLMRYMYRRPMLPGQL